MFSTIYVVELFSKKSDLTEVAVLPSYGFRRGQRGDMEGWIFEGNQVCIELLCRVDLSSFNIILQTMEYYSNGDIQILMVTRVGFWSSYFFEARTSCACNLIEVEVELA